jgi:sugar lactone lactonase YvrE
MKKVKLTALGAALLFCSAVSAQLPRNASFTTQATTPLAIEGLTADRNGNLYTTGRAISPCPVWRIDGSALTEVGFVPGLCGASGIAFDVHGDLYIADSASGGIVWRLAPDDAAPPTAIAFATGVPGTNGLAFDRDGNLWTGDGTSGLGRVWKIDPKGGECEPSFTGCAEAFRIQPMRNDAGVGRQNGTLQPGAPAPQAQNLVANGLAFTPDGDLYVADTARGAIWKVQLDRHGNVQSRMDCDTTFTANTLCLDAVFVAHPYLEGTDGIALDEAGNIWNSVNERNAIVVVTRQGTALEVFRNPLNEARLRNAANTAEGNRHILESPTSPVLAGKRFCTANSDGDRRDNSPRAAGEINGGAGNARGKISCMDLPLTIQGLPLPVR